MSGITAADPGASAAPEAAPAAQEQKAPQTTDTDTQKGNS